MASWSPGLERWPSYAGRVALADIDPRPLEGRTIVVTRATEQASSLVEALAALGADVVSVPVIAVVDPLDGGAALDAAATGLDRFDWVVVTSANGADRLAAAVAPHHPAPWPAAVAVVGPGTGDALRRHGVVPDLVPERFVAEGLLDVFPAPPASGAGRVLLAQADGARPVLREALVAAGWEVVAVEAYRTVHPPVATELVEAAAAADAITFTSASTVRGFVGAAGLAAVPPVVASIGPVTSEAVRAAGLEVSVEADEHTIPGLVEALVAHLGTSP